MSLSSSEHPVQQHDTDAHKRSGPPVALSVIFRDLLQRHAHKLSIRGPRAIGLAPCHEDRHPSFSANLDRGVWFCHACNRGGGVRDFAVLVGERWLSPRRPSRATTARHALSQAEHRARALLEQWRDEHERVLCADHRVLYGELLGVKDLLSLFARRPDLAAEFPALVADTEREYGDVLLRLAILEAQLNEEWAS